MYALTAFAALLSLTSPALAAIGSGCKGAAGSGTCQSVQNCAGISYTQNYCPNDPSNVMCCVAKKCTAGGKSGVCRSKAQFCPGGTFVAGGNCPSGHDYACCVQDASRTDTVPEKILAVAQTAADMPYAWGGGSCAGPSHDNPPYQYGDVGFDCSGLVSWAVCKVTGRDLFKEGLRVTSSMYCASESKLKYKKYPLAERKVGDAIFFGGKCDCKDSESIHHVGLVTYDTDVMINAPNDQINKVVDSTISKFGEKPCPQVIRFT